MSKVKDIILSYLALKDLIETDKEHKYVFKSSTRLKLLENLRKTSPVFNDFSTEKDALIKRLGEPVKDKPDTVQVKPENQPAFSKEVEEMYEAESDVVLNPLLHQELGENQIPIDLLLNLEKFGLLKGNPQ